MSCREIPPFPTTVFRVSELFTWRWGGAVGGLRSWPGHYKAWSAVATLEPGSGPTTPSLAPILPRTICPVQGRRKGEAPEVLPTTLGQAPATPYLFVLTLDFGNNGKPGWMFTWQGQGSVALVPASSLPEGSLGFGCWGDSRDVCDQLMISVIGAWRLSMWKIGVGLVWGWVHGGKSRSPE